MSITRQQIVDKAREYIGVPVVHAGRNKNGVDCIGLLICIAYDLGMYDINHVNYSPYVVPEQFVQELEKFATRKNEFATFELADIIMFNVGKWPHHVGLVSKLENGDGEISFIHTDMIAGKVVESRLDRSWSDRINCLYTINGIV